MDQLIYINGQWTGASLDKIPVHNPATSQIIGTVPKAGKKETRDAIDAAHSAFTSWSRLTAYERSEYLEKYYHLIIDNVNEIASILTLEMGKPLAEAKGEVRYAASFIKWFAEEGKRVYGRTIPSHVDGKEMLVLKAPVGVVAAITPWNFPAAMITRKMGPALAAGCTIVLKPAKQTPLTAIMLVKLAEQAGIPKGVVNLVTGNAAEIGGEFLSNPKVRKVTFTGSTEIGKELMIQAAQHVKNLSLELGGHAPILILDDADVDKAVKSVIASKFRNGGQTCICGNRVYVQEGIYIQFLEKLINETQQLKVGNGMDEGVDIGPLIDKNGFLKVDEHVHNATRLGAKCWVGGRRIEVQEDAYYYAPTVLSDVTQEMLIMNEETFGPVLPIQKVSTVEEAIAYANLTPYGLAAYVFTESHSLGMKVIHQLDFGIIGWNDGLPSAAQAPFGGMKESGLGREGGIEGLEAFLETKYVSIGL
ncbi:succinate semialdehyde dehydrogenase [Paenibacillus sp. yr247]|uniref:NAD-dependent succinate-semialdehyde dehydrogenase n=1 Tax=Paenibacillus sp. yr247 TaxID=1761880 RepID=UPI00087E38FD|nr:NAD-dependent succinate-semialdehyde dehydrogenase [Paenibacillus sp. yr247]SDO48411.1 succinate semialdehyde dehydrogenase [Paenibacillus sp. yr247]